MKHLYLNFEYSLLNSYGFDNIDSMVKWLIGLPLNNNFVGFDHDSKSGRIRFRFTIQEKDEHAFKKIVEERLENRKIEASK